MSLLDKLAKQEEIANTKKEQIIAAKSKHKFDSDDTCPECGKSMEATTVAGPLPARVCFDCRICLPAME